MGNCLKMFGRIIFFFLCWRIVFLENTIYDRILFHVFWDMYNKRQTKTTSFLFFNKKKKHRFFFGKKDGLNVIFKKKKDGLTAHKNADKQLRQRPSWEINPTKSANKEDQKPLEEGCCEAHEHPAQNGDLN